MSGPQRRSVSKELASHSISESASAAKSLQKRIDESPKVEDWKREFPGKVKVDEKTGDFSLKLTDDRDIKRAIEMQEGSRQEDIRRGAEVGAKYDGKKQRVVRRDGRVIEMRDDLIEHVKHKVRPVGRNGNCAPLRFGLNEAFGKYEQGPDGLWFVWNDGWEATNLFRKASAQSPQRDPDGNVWIERDNEWYLEDEVA